jgi:hypothetical protein
MWVGPRFQRAFKELVALAQAEQDRDVRGSGRPWLPVFRPDVLTFPMICQSTTFP